MNLWTSGNLSSEVLLSEFVLALSAGDVAAELVDEVPTNAIDYFLENLPERYTGTTKVVTSAGGPDGGPLVRIADPDPKTLKEFHRLLCCRLKGQVEI